MLAVACRIQFPDQRLNVGPLHWKHVVLATRPPGKSLSFILVMFRFFFPLCLICTKKNQTFKPKNTLYFSPKFGMMKKHIQEIVLLCIAPVLKKLRLKDLFFLSAVFQLHLKNLRELASLHTKCHELCLHCLSIALWGFLHRKPSSSWTVWVALLVYNNSKLLEFCELIEADSSTSL